jgi:hypothetical protein
MMVEAGVDGFDVDHPGLPSLKIDRAARIDALTPARLLDRRLLLFGRPAAEPRRMGGPKRYNSAISPEPPS